MVRCAIEFLTGQPTLGYLDSSTLDRLTIADQCKTHTVDMQKPTIWKYHGSQSEDINNMTDILQNEGKLILIVRNPIECLIRHNGKLKFLDWVSDNKHSREIQYFSNNIEFYYNYGGKKMIVYYEDCIVGDNDIWRKIGYFFKSTSDRIEEFLKTKDDVLSISLNNYPDCQSGGQQVLYYTNQLDSNQLTKAWNKIENASNNILHKEIVERYI